jgi:putative membrane protein insertion efficiency factor
MSRAETLQGRALNAAFALYRRVLSPTLHSLSFLRGGCAYQPTCSEYAQLALAQHGLLRGGALALWRLLRCNPFSRGGWDPVRVAPAAVKAPRRVPRGT